MRVPLLLVFLATITSANARIGETPIQFADRYGRPKDTAADKSPNAMFALVEGAIHHTYEYQGWKIRAAFLQLDGPAVRMEFQKIPGAGRSSVIQAYELEAITAANTPAGMSWNPITYNNPDSPSKGIGKVFEAFVMETAGQKMWQRSDGAILWVRSNLIMRLELPVTRQYEERLKLARDQKAHASVPQF